MPLNENTLQKRSIKRIRYYEFLLDAGFIKGCTHLAYGKPAYQKEGNRLYCKICGELIIHTIR